MLHRKRRLGAAGGLGLEESLDWVKWLLLMVVMMMVELLLLMIEMVMVVVLVMFKRHAVVTQPVLGRLRHGLKHSSNTRNTSLSLHEVGNSWTIL